MLKKITLILLIILTGCKSYEDRFFIQDYDESSADITYSETKYHDINGSKQRVKQLDFDSKNVLRKEIFFGDEFINKIRFYDENGVLAKEEIFNVSQKDKLTGQRILYYPNTNKKEEYDFSNGKKDGYYTSYYTNGALESDLEYTSGTLSGSCSWYYPSGNLMKIQEFLSREYYQIEYYENGSKRSEGSFRGESFIGHWVFYDQYENVIREENY